jgi:hypothetical protein
MAARISGIAQTIKEFSRLEYQPEQERHGGDRHDTGKP